VEEEEGLSDDGRTEIEREEDNSYKPYQNALRTYLRRLERIAEMEVVADDGAWDVASEEIADEIMQMDDGDDDEGMERPQQPHQSQLPQQPLQREDAELKFLRDVSQISLSRINCTADAQDEAARNEGNFWDLLCFLRSVGSSSLFYRVAVDDENGDEAPSPKVELLRDPAEMVDSPPGEVLDACLWGNTGPEPGPCLPLARLQASLSWIEACHGRDLERALSRDYVGSDDPLLPPPRRRTMWPETMAELSRETKAAAGSFHPDAPLERIESTSTRRSASPTDVAATIIASHLPTRDETDDARLLRACLFLFRSGRGEEALELARECGQPWRAIGWVGGGYGDVGDGDNDGAMEDYRARRLWKRRCREIAALMGRGARNGGTDAEGADAAPRRLHPSLAYEAGILALLSDAVDAALENPVFESWENAVHAVLSAERGIVEEEVLRMHNRARVEAAGGKDAVFPFPGMVSDEDEDESGASDAGAILGHDADLGAAMEMLSRSPFKAVREGGGDPFRNGMMSFMIGGGAVQEYLEEAAVLAVQLREEDEASFLRFAVHLVLYVDSVFPELSTRLAVPADDDGTEYGEVTLREFLLLRYASFLASSRNLWSQVALYASLLSNQHMIDMYADFLLQVHGDAERQMTLEQAREFFPEGADIVVLRNVVRDMILGDQEDFTRIPGEPLAPSGISPVNARLMRSIHWMCYHPEHMPDALVCTNMLLRRFFLLNEMDASDPSQSNLYDSKYFIEKVLPTNLVDMAVDQCGSNIIGGNAPHVPEPMVQNLKAEFVSFESFLKAHTKYAQFLDVISKTSPCHNAKSGASNRGRRSAMESEISDKLERNAFRQRKVAICKIVIEAARRASDGWMDVLTFAGGWLVDLDDLASIDAESAVDAGEMELRAAEMKEIRSTVLPAAVSMLHDVLGKTASWMEQMVHDIVDQFGGNAAKDILVSLFHTFDETYRSSASQAPMMEVVTTSQAAPAYWYKKAVALSSIVANDSYGIHETFSDDEMEKLLRLVAESVVGLQRTLDVETIFE